MMAVTCAAIPRLQPRCVPVYHGSRAARTLHAPGREGGPGAWCRRTASRLSTTVARRVRCREVARTR